VREVMIKPGRVVKSPWLRIDEAAAYCGISRSMFDQHSRELPFGGDKRTRLYHVKELDRWVRGDLDVPFTLKEEEGRRPKRRVFRHSVDQDDMVLTDPRTGKVYRPKG